MRQCQQLCKRAEFLLGGRFCVVYKRRGLVTLHRQSGDGLPWAIGEDHAYDFPSYVACAAFLKSLLVEVC